MLSVIGIIVACRDSVVYKGMSTNPWRMDLFVRRLLLSLGQDI